MDQISKERRMQMSIEAFNKGQFPSKTACAKAFGVPPSTFITRVNKATAPRKENTANGLKLSDSEEETLSEWILDMCKRGLPLQTSNVRYFAQLLLSARLKSSEKPTVGDQWINQFIQRHPGLKSQHDRQHERQHDYSCADCEDPGLLNDWFCRVQETVQKYGILEQDTYNMDEFGFEIDMESTPKVVHGADARYNHTKTAQPGNREWISLIIAINATGTVLPPQFVLTGKDPLSQWYSEELPDNYRVWMSENGWADGGSRLRWLQMFETLTAPQAAGKYRLLIVDGHRSHATASFDHFCTERKIIPLYLPPYSTHLLQPLDVSCFVPLEHFYRQEMRERIEDNPHAIDKREMLSVYTEVHSIAFSKSNILSGFTDAGLIPLNPERVLAKLEAEAKTPMPPLSSDESFNFEKSTFSIPELKQQQQQLRDDQKETLSLVAVDIGDRKLIKELEKFFRGVEYFMWITIRLKRETERLRAFYKRLDEEEYQEDHDD